MEEDFENVGCWFPDENLHDLVVLYEDYKSLLTAYKELKGRHQKLLDLAGGQYL